MTNFLNYIVVIIISCMCKREMATSLAPAMVHHAAMRLCNRIIDSKDLSSYLVKLGRGIDGERISQFLECCLNGLPLLFYDQGWCSNL